VRPALLLVLLLAGCGGASPARSQRTPVPARTPAPRTDAAAVAARAHVPVLCYHQVREPTAADGADARPYIVSPRGLARQMDALDRAGYTAVSGDALVAHLARGAPLPRKPVLITFDDASEGQYTRALPILRRHGFTATFFVMTVVLGKPGWLSRGQVRALDRAGMEIGAHTWDHSPVPGYEGSDWTTQIGRPKLDLQRIVGHPVRLFAYPFGEWTPRAFPNLRRVGFTAAFQLADRLDRDAPLWTIRRIIAADVPGRELLRRMRQEF
jgi:peptidoglycan/xylan/chitin deacetylase (PgdA/CDA1 family)